MESFMATLTSIANSLADFGLKLIGAVLILIIGFKVIKLITKALNKNGGFVKMDEGVRSFLGSILSIGLKALVIISAAAVVGFPMASVVALIGTVGVAIGLALQGSLGNLASGVVILINKPFTVGDYITVSGQSGRVQEIGFFYISLISDDSRKINIPNAKITNEIIINSSAYDMRRLDLELSVESEEDTETVKNKILEDIRSRDGVLAKPEPKAIVTDKTGSIQSYRIELWIAKKDFEDVSTRLTEHIKIKYSK